MPLTFTCFELYTPNENIYTGLLTNGKAEYSCKSANQNKLVSERGRYYCFVVSFFVNPTRDKKKSQSDSPQNRKYNLFMYKHVLDILIFNQCVASM